MQTAQEVYPGRVTQVVQKDDCFYISCEPQMTLAVMVYQPTVVRFRYATDSIFEEDFSYAIDKKYKANAGALSYTEEETVHVINTEALRITIHKADSRVNIYNHDGVLVCEDEKGFHWEDNYKAGGNIVQMSKVAQSGECFYGLGDKPTHLNLRGKRLVNWGSDVYGFNKDQDPLYKNIPFYMGLHHGEGYGIFFDNTFKAHFDFASERKSVASFWADGGEMNYYFIYGPDLVDVTRQYTVLTGTPELPPLWALGFHQCKWSYYPESEVREITSKFRELRLPIDAIYLDIDYMDGFRCFTWDKEKFPAPKQMVADLRDQGFKTIVIIDPGIKVDPEYWVFKEGLEKNMFCRRADGPHMKGKVWPGDCYFPDFTNPKVRRWWADLFEELISDTGVSGVWNDMNEPALFEVENKSFPDDVRHDYDGHPCSHRKAHNIYGMQMARATYKGVKRYMKQDNKRPFVITRSAYAGTQKYSSAWTGDNIASWEHLWIANLQVQRMNVSGFGFCGSDVGGFIEHPTPELFIRWMQLATFHPFFRVHSSGDHGVQEPWSFGEQATDISRQYLELRYQLLPYLYTAFYEYTTYGTPIIKPLAYVAQTDVETHNRVDEFIVGNDLLVCPILESNTKGRYLYLPEGEWMYWWTDQLYAGQKEMWIDCNLEQIPLFVRSGAVVPMFPVQQYVGEKTIESCALHVFAGEATHTSNHYQDSGDGYEHETGTYNVVDFHYHKEGNQIKLTQDIKGHYTPSFTTYGLILHGINSDDVEVYVNDVQLDKELIVKDDLGRYAFEVDRKWLNITIHHV
jgi:alpha-glucosidase